VTRAQAPAAGGIHPFYLGEREDVFAVLHRPAGPARAAGAILCPPLFGEYVQHHRALYQLAARLAERGIPALRFDWAGTGDSAGDLADASLARWRRDVAAAVAALETHAGTRRMVLAGARFGATLAALATADHPRVEALALWEPVADGAAYLAELADAHLDNLAPYVPGLAHPAAGDGARDVLGFEVPHALWEEVGAARLAGAELPPSLRVLVVAHPERHAATRAALDPRLTRVWFHAAVPPRGWLAPEDGIYDVLVPIDPVGAMVDWIDRSVA
jgi:alpha/beta superfamily hydrolase